MGGRERRWRVEVHRVAEKGIKRLPKEFIEIIWETIKSLETDPFPDGYIKMRGYDDLYRIRVGEFRIIYSVINDRTIILVLEVSPRGAAYKSRY